MKRFILLFVFDLVTVDIVSVENNSREKEILKNDLEISEIERKLNYLIPSAFVSTIVVPGSMVVTNSFINLKDLINNGHNNFYRRNFNLSVVNKALRLTKRVGISAFCFGLASIGYILNLLLKGANLSYLNKELKQF